MTASGPTALPATYTPSTPSATLAAVGHDGMHRDIQDEERALWAKLGLSTSTPVTGTVLRGTGTGTTAFGPVVNADISASAAIDPLKLAGQGYFAIFSGANQSISNTTVTDLTFASETEDLLAMHSTSTNTNRVVIPTGYGGLWIFSVTLGWSAGGTGVRITNIAVNGTVVYGNTWPPFGAVVRDSLTTPPVRVVATDIITAHVYQDSGGALGVDGTSIPILFKGARIG